MLDGNDVVFDIPDHTSSPDIQILNKERHSAVVRFFEDLRRIRPHAKRQIDVLALRCIEDLDYPEIAERLKITVENAYTRYSRIVATIRADAELLRRAQELGLGHME